MVLFLFFSFFCYITVFLKSFSPDLHTSCEHLRNKNNFSLLLVQCFPLKQMFIFSGSCLPRTPFHVPPGLDTCSARGQAGHTDAAVSERVYILIKYLSNIIRHEGQNFNLTQVFQNILCECVWRGQCDGLSTLRLSSSPGLGSAPSFFFFLPRIVPVKPAWSHVCRYYE